MQSKESKEATRKRWRAANRAKIRATKARWRAANPDKERVMAAKYRSANLDKEIKRSARYRATNPDKVRDHHLKGTGFTAILFRETVKKQNGRCAICLVLFDTLPKHAAHADHDHLTGAPRGALCRNCNAALGFFKDNPAYLRAAINYLKKPTLSHP